LFATEAAMNFSEAQARFQWLESQRAAGRMNEQAYRSELNQLRVTDAWGRQWMLQERTGQWHVYDGRQWVPAAPLAQPAPPPPIQPAYQPPVPQPQPYQPAYPSAAPASARSEGSACAKFLLYGVIWLVIWVIIAVVVYIFAAQKEPAILLGVAAAALLSLVLMLFSLASHWQGQIVEIKKERVRVQRGEDDWGWEDQTFAHVRQPNGRIRKMRAMGGWQVGNYLEKRRGEAHIRVTR
jgi:hypothetical protein